MKKCTPFTTRTVKTPIQSTHNSRTLPVMMWGHMLSGMEKIAEEWLPLVIRVQMLIIARKMGEQGTTSRTKVGVIGGGAWGTALGIHCARIGHDTLLWAKEPEVVEAINREDVRENVQFFSGFKVPPGMKATEDLGDVVRHGSVLLMVVPTPFVESTLGSVVQLFDGSLKILVSCTKGILNDSLETVDEILQRIMPKSFHSRLAYLSGPSFAREVAQKLPTVVTIASKDSEVALTVQRLLSTSRFRCYRTDDVVGVELGGALKNVLAIACGISDGLQCGNNGRAALITRGHCTAFFVNFVGAVHAAGLNEITKLAVGKGANPLTMGGLAGMGDLVLTCTGDLSRNRTVGLRLGQGETLEEIRKSMVAVAEGVLTSKSAFELSMKLKIECPIIEGIFRVIHLGADPVKMLDDVMTRTLKEEIDPSIQDAAATYG